MLVARVNIIQDTLRYFYKNWNSKYQYPVYIHTFGKIIDNELKKKINNNISENIFFIEINPKIPKQIKTNELYFNRQYLRYVRKYFTKKRLGFLHMCNFLTNINSYGKTGCLSKKLKKFDNLMFLDDDIYFKRRINFDFFDYLKKYPAAALSCEKLAKNQTTKDVTENLWSFYRNLMIKKKIKPKNKLLNDFIKYNNENVFYKINWTYGCLELYNIRKLEKKNLNNYITELNTYGGAYKHRWNNSYVINLFLMTFFKRPFYNLNLIKKGLIDTKIKGAENFVYWGYKDAYTSNFFKLFIKIKNFVIGLNK